MGRKINSKKLERLPQISMKIDQKTRKMGDRRAVREANGERKGKRRKRGEGCRVQGTRLHALPYYTTGGSARHVPPVVVKSWLKSGSKASSDRFDSVGFPLWIRPETGNRFSTQTPGDIGTGGALLGDKTCSSSPERRTTCDIQSSAFVASLRHGHGFKLVMLPKHRRCDGALSPICVKRNP